MNVEKYKTASPRFFAILIDGLVLALFIYIESFFIIPEIPTSIVIIGLIIHYFCTHFYNIYLHTVYGKTLGKMAMKVEVLDISENPITLRQAILREIPIIAFSLISLGSEMYQILTVGIDENFRNSFFDNSVTLVIVCWTVAEIIVMLSNEKRRTIHDYIAGTVVVKTNV